MDLRWKAGIAGLAVAAGVLVAAAGPAHPTARPSAAGGRSAGGALGTVPVAPRVQPATPGPVTVDTLRATVARLTDTGHNVTMKTVDTLTTGSVDPADGLTAISINQGFSSEFEETVVDGTVYLRMDLDPTTNQQFGIDPGRWMRLDRAKLPADNLLPVPPDASDPVDMPGILDGVTAAKRVNATNFLGTINLGKVDGRNLPDAAEVAAAGAPATRAPFSLTTDDQGRIAQFTVDTSGFDPTLSLDVSFTNYGIEDTVTPPPSAVPAPASVYALFKP